MSVFLGYPAEVDLDEIARLQGALIGGGAAVAVLLFIRWNAAKRPPPWEHDPDEGAPPEPKAEEEEAPQNGQAPGGRLP